MFSQYAQCSHAFFAHHDGPVPADGVGASGVAPDGGTFTTVQPPVPLGTKPQLQGAPPYVFAGPESTMAAGDMPKEGVVDKVTDVLKG